MHDTLEMSQVTCERLEAISCWEAEKLYLALLPQMQRNFASYVVLPVKTRGPLGFFRSAASLRACLFGTKCYEGDKSQGGS